MSAERKSKTAQESVKKPLITPEDQAQIDAAFTEVEAAKDVSLSTWNSLTNDAHFGPALQYIASVAFRQRPFTYVCSSAGRPHYLGSNLVDGPHPDYMSLPKISISAKADVARPFFLNLCPIMESCVLGRQFWVVNTRDAGVSYLGLQPIINRDFGSVDDLSWRITPLVSGSGMALISVIDRLGWMEKEQQNRHYLVIVTYARSMAIMPGPRIKFWHRICFTIVKPPVEPLVMG